MNLASTSMNMFIILTIIYFVVHYYISKDQKKIVDYIYYLFTITFQLVIVFMYSKQICGTPQIKSVFIWGLIPWFFIFFGIVTLLKVFPGWKSPFSNTFGYAITKLMGISSLFNSLLKNNYNISDSSMGKIMQNIYQDESLLINELNPSNFDSAIQKLKPIFDTKSSGYALGIEKLRKMVLLKDEVSRFIWYLFTGGLVVSLSNMGITTTKCQRDVSQVRKEMDTYNAALKRNRKLAEKQKKNQRIYKITE